VILQKISFAEGTQMPKVLEELKDRRTVLAWMHKQGIADFQHVCEVINMYYKDKPQVMEWMKKGLNPFKENVWPEKHPAEKKGKKEQKKSKQKSGKKEETKDRRQE
jgi:hypothetical protein